MIASFRWLAPVVLAVGLGAAGLAAPTTARAGDDLIRVIVDVADVIYHGGNPYYRHGGYGPRDRIIVERGRYGRPVYYRYVTRGPAYGYGPPYGNAYGYRDRVRYDYRGWDRGRYDRDDRRAYRAGYRDGRRAERWDDRHDDRRRWRDRDDD